MLTRPIRADPGCLVAGDAHPVLLAQSESDLLSEDQANSTDL